MFQLQGFPFFRNNFSLLWLHSFPVLLKLFPCLLYRVFPVLLKIQIYRDFPVLVTTFLCFNYRVFPALITYFPCFGYIISLFYEHCFPVLFTGFSLLLQNFMLLFFKEQGNPCYKNINIIPVQNTYISLYFNELLTLQTLYTAKACKGRITTQGDPCKKPVLSL